MDKSTILNAPVYREERFRNPSPLEKKIGLWVDRIGEQSTGPQPMRLRILGQYAAVQIESGRGTFVSTTAGSIALQGREVVLVFPDIPTFYGPDTEWRTRWVVWNGPDARQLEKMGYIRPARPVIREAGETVARAFRQLTAIIDREDKGAVLERKMVVLAMVQALSGSQERTTVSSHLHGCLAESVHYIQQHYAEPITVPALARRYNLSVTHFRRLFKEYSGRSPKDYLIGWRITRAKELLAGGRRIKEVAQAVGFADEFYFMRIFKKVAGVPPGQYLF